MDYVLSEVAKVGWYRLIPMEGRPTNTCAHCRTDTI